MARRPRSGRFERARRLPLALVPLVLTAPIVSAQESVSTASSNAELAQKLSNPVASLVSVPFQFNWDQPVGIDDDTRYTLNIQPVIPLSISEEWNLIVRWIMPYISQPRLAPGAGPTSGFSDIVASFFLSPAKAGALTWGVGPVFLLPTNSDPLLGTGKWAAGPTAVVLQQSGAFTLGLLANHLWSFAGDDFTGGAARSDVNQTFLQPFVAYTTPTAWTFSANLEASANWEAEEEWTVPLNLLVSKLVELGPFPMSVGAGPGFYLTAPGDRPDWRLRVVATILLPKS
ncbi:MAG: transporter [Gemmatimonadota bacterium]